jgi:predicted GH43/DUF377 family glycosyl hydrolase
MKNLSYSFILISIFILPSCLFSQMFVPHPENPVLTLTQPNPGVWNDPSVLKVGDEYWMYATSASDTTGIWDGDVLPYLLKSNNGINWTLSSNAPLLLSNTDTTAWDAAGIETPSVVLFNSIFHMYYTAVSFDHPYGQFAIGHATSVDGENWIRDTIILAPSNIPADWMSYSVAEPGAVVYKDSIYLYFTGIGARLDTTYPAGKSVIGLAVSEDGFVFGAPHEVLSQGVQYPPSDGFYGYSTPNALAIDDTIHLYYDVAQEIPDWTQVAIHHAYSANGITNFVEDQTSIFHKNDFEWTAREIRCPAVMLDSSEIKMWFGGDDYFNSGTYGIGYASLNISTTNINNIQTESIFSIYPNPNNGLFTINSDLSNSLVVIYDLRGTVIYRAAIGNRSLIDMNITGPLSGLYFVKLISDNGKVFTKKMMVIK